MATTALEAALDALFAVAPEDFVESRKKLVTELKASGHADDAKVLASQPKPTRGAYLLNQVARTFSAEVDGLGMIGVQLSKAHASGEALREVIVAQREALQSLNSKVAALASKLNVSAHDVAAVTTALHGATTSSARAKALALGRFEKVPESTASFLGTDVATPGAVFAPLELVPKQVTHSVDEAARQAELNKLRRDLSEAKRAASEAIHQATQSAKNAQRRERELEVLAARAEVAERETREARAAHQTARGALDEAKREAEARASEAERLSRAHDTVAALLEKS